MLDDKLYGGKATSRATIFGQEKGGSDNDSDEDVDGLMIEGSSGRQEDEEDIDEVERKDDDGGDYEQAEEDSQKSEDEVPGDLEQEYNQLQQEEAETMKVLQQHRDAQRKKGLAVYAQQRIWDGALEIRILLQRVLQGANRFPRSKARNTIKKLDPQLYSGLQGVANMAAGALEDVLGLLSAIERQNPALLESGSMIESSKQPSKNKMTGRKRTIEELWGRLDDAYNRFIPFRDAAVDRWHRKTMLASGTAARGGLKVLNQTISSQVKMLMQDVDRVVERSRMPKRSITALCSVESEVSCNCIHFNVWDQGGEVHSQFAVVVITVVTGRGAGSFTCELEIWKYFGHARVGDRYKLRGAQRVNSVGLWAAMPPPVTHARSPLPSSLCRGGTDSDD